MRKSLLASLPFFPYLEFSYFCTWEREWSWNKTRVWILALPLTSRLPLGKVLDVTETDDKRQVEKAGGEAHVAELDMAFGNRSAQPIVRRTLNVSFPPLRLWPYPSLEDEHTSLFTCLLTWVLDSRGPTHPGDSPSLYLADSVTSTSLNSSSVGSPEVA